MQIGIYEKAINSKFTWREKIRIAKAAGFDFIEFSVDESPARLARLDWSKATIMELRQLLIAEDFHFNSMALSGLRKYPYGAASKATRAKAVLITKKAIRLAKQLGIRVIQLAGYDVYYEQATASSKRHFRASVREVLTFASEHSVMLAFEIMDTAFMGTISNFYAVLKGIRSPWLRLYPDLGNLWQWAGPNLAKELARGRHDIVGIHFKDTKPGLFRDVPFGTGTVNFRKVFTILQDLKYNGPFLIEMWSANDLGETSGANVQRLKAALAFFKKEQQNVSKT